MIELALVLAVMLTLSLAVWKGVAGREHERDVTLTRASSERLLDAVDAFYSAHCADATFPTVTVGLLQAEGFLSGSTPANHLGNAFTVGVNLAASPKVIWVRADITEPGDITYYEGVLRATASNAATRELTWTRMPGMHRKTRNLRNRSFSDMYGVPGQC